MDEMADTRKCMLLYHSWLPAMEELSDEEVGRLLRGALKYSKDGELPEIVGNERYTWPLLKYQIDADAAKYNKTIEKRSAAGTASANKRKQMLASVGTCQHVSADEDKIKEKEKEKTKEIIKETPSKKEAKKDAFEEFAGDNEKLLKALRAFEEMRKVIKHPLSPAAKDRVIGKLMWFDEASWIPILDQSILNSWQDIYPLKEQQPKRTTKKSNQTITAEEYNAKPPEGINAAQLNKIMQMTGGV